MGLMWICLWDLTVSLRKFTEAKWENVRNIPQYSRRFPYHKYKSTNCLWEFLVIRPCLYDTHFATFRVKFTAPCVHINIHTIFIYTRYFWDYISCNMHIQIMRNKNNQEEHLSVTFVTNELSYCTCCTERCIPVRVAISQPNCHATYLLIWHKPPHFRCRRRILHVLHPSWGL